MTFTRTRNIKLVAPAVLCAAAIAAGCGGDGDGDDSTQGTEASATLAPCEISGKQQSLGASYVTSIEVQTIGCKEAEQVVKAYHQCRQANGGAGGTCETEVQGFTCTEGEREEVPGVQYNAEVDCKGDAGEVRSTYTQNL